MVQARPKKVHAKKIDPRGAIDHFRTIPPAAYRALSRVIVVIDVVTQRDLARRLARGRWRFNASRAWCLVSFGLRPNLVPSAMARILRGKSLGSVHLWTERARISR